MTVSIGLSVWSGLVGQTMPYLDQVSGPFDSLWFPDHVQYGSKNVAEGWSLLTYALARYPDKICAHQVLCNSFRNPAHLAKMAATVQALSGGRFLLGLGAGWNEEEYQAYGWPFPKARTRVAQLAEAIQIIKRMWTEQPANFAGDHYQIADAYCEPQPDPIPAIVIGGAGEKYLLRVVAQYADEWNYIFQDRAGYAHKQAVLQDHCQAVGRDYDEIDQAIASHILIGENEKAVTKLLDDPAVRPVSVNGFAGTPEQITEQLLTAIDQGAKRIVVGFADAPCTDGTQLFTERVLPHLISHRNQN